MIIKQLGIEERAGCGATYKITLTHEDLTTTTSGTAQVIALLTLTAGQKVRACKVDLETEFTGGSLSALAATIGDAATGANYLLTSSSLLTGDTPITYKDGTGTMKVYTAADTLDITVTPTADSVSAATAGKLNIYVQVEDSMADSR